MFQAWVSLGEENLLWKTIQQQTACRMHKGQKESEEEGREEDRRKKKRKREKEIKKAAVAKRSSGTQLSRLPLD